MNPLGLITGGISTIIGLGQAISGAKRKRRAERDLEGFANSFQPNSSIMDYYDKAYAKYNTNPFQSNSYQQQNNMTQRNLATGLSSAQSRRGGLGVIAGLTQQANDASGRAVSNAEGMQRQDLSQLGQAAGMKTQEQQKKFDMLYNLKAQKAGQAASQENTGIRNTFSGLGYLSTLYGSNTNGDTGSTDSYQGRNAWRMPRSNYMP